MRMRAWGWFALTGLVLASAPGAAAQGSGVLTAGGLGPVTIGMSVGAAQRALGTRLRSLVPAYTGSCWVGVRADRRQKGVSYMIESGRITRIDIYEPPGRDMPKVTTAKAIGIGASEAEVRQAYGAALIERPEPDQPAGLQFLVKGPAGRGIVMQIVHGTVAALWAGRQASIDYTEMCS